MQTCIECGRDLDRSKVRYGTSVCGLHGQYYDANKWPFKSSLWRDCNFQNVQLQKVHRQTDSKYTEILHTLRKGAEWTLEQENLLFNHSHSVLFDEAIKLNPLRREVDTINETHMEQLTAPIQR
jgi:hypothetical protein